MDDEQVIRKRKLAELKARREQRNRANAALVDQGEAREQKPTGGGLPGPDEVYAVSVFGQAGGGGDSMSPKKSAAPLIVGWRTGDAQNAGSQPSGPRGAPPAAGQAKNQPPATYPGPSGGPGPGPPPPPPPPSTNHHYNPAPFGASPHVASNGAWHGGPYPPAVPVGPGQPMEHFLPGDPRGGHPPPPHHAFVPLPAPQGGSHGMLGGRGVPGMHGRGGAAQGPRGPRGQSQYFHPSPRLLPDSGGFGPPRGNLGVRGGGDMRGMGARYGRQRGRTGGRGGGRGGRQGGREGYREHDNDGGGSGGFFKASFVEDPWKELLSKSSPPPTFT